MKIICVIPARYNSTRFPGKPLADICGKPMIWWVFQQCEKVDDFDSVYIATDDERIVDVCKQHNMNVIMTSPANKTGTDRVAEVAEKISADIYVNVQGDEPIIETETIREVIKTITSNDEISVASLMTPITNPVDVANNTVCKAVTNNDGYCIYLSRAPIPYPKGSIDYRYMKALGIFAFTPDSLKFFKEYGNKKGKSKNEKIEDIELLRFIENGYKVKFSIVSSDSIAVDTPNDLNAVKKIIQGNNDDNDS